MSAFTAPQRMVGEITAITSKKNGFLKPKVDNNDEASLSADGIYFHIDDLTFSPESLGKDTTQLWVGQTIEFSIGGAEKNTENNGKTSRARAVNVTSKNGFPLQENYLQFEEEISWYLDSLNVSYKRDSKLRAAEKWAVDKTDKDGKKGKKSMKAANVANAPDFLVLTKDFRINGRPISWIDAKSYALPSIGKIHDKIERQTDRKSVV